jgi:Flp pilus assembly CpaF family ATPase/pSer/pThr/pTyr-binding forkhead associated (FHA) protein
MIIWYNHISESKQNHCEIDSESVSIGRHRDNDIVLSNPGVALYAAVVNRNENGVWELSTFGINGVQIDDKRIENGQTVQLPSNGAFRIFPYDIVVDIPKDETLTAKKRFGYYEKELADIVYNIHGELLIRMKQEGHGESGNTKLSDQYLIKIEEHIEGIINEHKFINYDKSEIVLYAAGMCVRDVVYDVLASDRSKGFSPFQEKNHWSRIFTAIPNMEDELKRAAQHVLIVLKTETISDYEGKLLHVEEHFNECWEELSKSNVIRFNLIEYLCVRYFKKTIKDILFGYGPLEDLIRMPIISEIMVINSDKIYIEKAGKLQNSRRRFVSDEVTITIIKRIVSKVNRHIDKSTPLVDARLSDGSRVNAIIDPLAVSGPCLTIRKFPETRIKVEDLVRIGSLTVQAAEFLQASVVNRRNIIVSGGTGSGKTTLLNCLGDYIPDNERIITIEDTAELNLKKDHLVRLETREANIEGKGAYTIRDLVRNALRMRPDRIIVGECRGAETLDMLQAMNTGHDGSLTTIHANSAEDVVLRLEVLVQMAADLPISSIHQQIVSAIDLVVQLKRLKNGRRCVSQIAEVAGIDPPTQRIVLRNLYLLDSENEDALLIPTGSLPSYMNILMEHNLIQLNNFFT